MGSPSATGNQPDAGRPPRGGRVPQQRGGRAGGSALARPRRADLAVVASNAVVTYLRQATERPAEQDAALDQESAPDLAMSGILAAGADPGGAQDVAVRAAAVSVVTLDRVESAAAKLEADIAAARREQAELQAGAGRAAAEAIRAAEQASGAADTAQEAGRSAKRSMRVIGTYLIITGILAIIQLLILVAFAASAH